MHNKTSVFVAGLFLWAGMALPCFAHVTLVQPTGQAGHEIVALFRVGHGCGASPTTSLTVEIPAGIAGARPQAKAGWTLEMQKAAPAGRVSAITWQGGSLAADAFDEFAILMKLPDAPGTLVFPATQTCASGVEHWSQLPVPGQKLAHPAPVLTVTPGSVSGGMPGMIMPDGSHM